MDLGPGAELDQNFLLLKSRLERSTFALRSGNQQLLRLPEVDQFVRTAVSGDEPSTIVDLGCWWGDLLIDLNERFGDLLTPGSHLIGLDSGLYRDSPRGADYTPLEVPDARLLEVMNDLEQGLIYLHPGPVYAIYGELEDAGGLELGRGRFGELWREGTMLDLVFIQRMFGYVPWKSVMEEISPLTRYLVLADYSGLEPFHFEIPTLDTVNNYLDDQGYEIMGTSDSLDPTPSHFWYTLARRI